MGGKVAQHKLWLESEVVEFDFAAPDMLMSKGDREGLKGNEEEVTKFIRETNPDESDPKTVATLVRAMQLKIAIAKAVAMTIKAFVQSKFTPEPPAQSGMKKQDRAIYAAWQEIMGEDEEDIEPFTHGTVFEMPMKQLDWLRKIVKDENVKITWMMAQWAEAVQDYVCAIQPKAKEPKPEYMPAEAEKKADE